MELRFEKGGSMAQGARGKQFCIHPEGISKVVDGRVKIAAYNFTTRLNHTIDVSNYSVESGSNVHTGRIEACEELGNLPGKVMVFKDRVSIFPSR